MTLTPVLFTPVGLEVRNKGVNRSALNSPHCWVTHLCDRPSETDPGRPLGASEINMLLLRTYPGPAFTRRDSGVFKNPVMSRRLRVEAMGGKGQGVGGGAGEGGEAVPRTALEKSC